MRTNRLQVYEDKHGEWRWRLRAPNGRIIADSAEGYVNRSGALRAARKLIGTPIALEAGQ
jgi:uncharacterized protein YegP (UPF0339 family)